MKFENEKEFELELMKSAMISELAEIAFKLFPHMETCAELAEKISVQALKKIQNVLSQHEELSDFEIVDKIVDIFDNYKITTNGCHDW